MQVKCEVEAVRVDQGAFDALMESDDPPGTPSPDSPGFPWADYGDGITPYDPCYILSVANVTKLASRAPQLKRLRSDAIALTEHSTPPRENTLVRHALQPTHRFHLSQCDSELQGNRGGTGLVMRGRDPPYH